MDLTDGPTTGRRLWIIPFRSLFSRWAVLIANDPGVCPKMSIKKKITIICHKCIVICSPRSKHVLLTYCCHANMSKNKNLCLIHRAFLPDLRYSNKTKKPHLTRQYQRPRPTPDRLALHFADSSPSPRLVLGPSLQGGHYNSPLHLTCNIYQHYIITTYSVPCGNQWFTSGPAHREEVPPQRASFGQFWPRAAHLTAATQIFRAQIVEQPQHYFCWKLGNVSRWAPSLFQFWGK